MTGFLLALALQVAPTISPPPGTAGSTTTAPPRITIRGRVLGVDGRPIRHAQVQTFSVEPPLIGAVTATDDDGRYEFAIPVGEYTMSASRVGYLALQYGQRRPTDKGEHVRVEASGVHEHIDFALPRAAAIAGRVLDELGDPLQGATVSLSHFRFFRGRRRIVEVPGVGGATTDDRGHFRIYGVPPGDYLLSGSIGQLIPGLRVSDVPGYAATYFPGTPNPAEARHITVGVSQDVLDADFQMVRSPSATIRGRAVSSAGEPLQGGISLVPSQQLGFTSGAAAGARTRPDGSFEFRNVPPGTYVVQVQRSRANQATEAEFGAARVSINGSDLSDLIVQTTPGSRIAGRIILDGGAREPNRNAIDLSTYPMDLDFAPANGQFARADIRDDWSFMMNGINGARRLRLARAPRGWGLAAIRVGGVDVTDTPLTFGTADQSVTDVEVVLTTRITTIDASVTDTRGQPVGDCSVVAFATDQTLWYAQSRFFKLATRDASGPFRIEALPPGDYFVAAIARTFTGNAADDWQDPDLLEQIVARSTRVSIAEAQHLSVSLKLP